jgi:glycine cleavage system H protein
MTVILVLLTFIVFLAADLVLNWKKSASPALAVASPKPLPNDLVEGIPVPANLRYHPGHTWLSRERKNVLRVGMDAFAVALAGPIESIEVPKPGHWIRQGQKAIMIHRDGETIELLSPVEGEVTEVNTEAVSHPATFSQDPYGKGWLFRVYAPDEEGPSRNLLPAALVRPWMRNAMERLYQLQPDFAGATAADGGLPVENLAAALPHLPAKQLAEEFFLS